MAAACGNPPKPSIASQFKKPVAWLLGRQLIASFKRIALYAAFSDKLDPKDWMRPKTISFEDDRDEAFWFDYFADTGDGQMATYGIAYLCLSDLWVISVT